MNISPDGVTVRFKTEPEDLFYFEKSGAKSNTVRIIDHYERQQLKKKFPQKIIIQHEQEIFLRTVTHVYVSERILGKYIAIFSWINEKHYHPTSNGTEQDPKAYTMSLEDPKAEVIDKGEEPSIDKNFAAITVSKGTLALLQSIAHGRTMNMVINELYEAYMYQREVKTKGDV